MKTIFCFGDSNTWGYDPRSILEDRYEADARWCDLLGKALSCRVLNRGANGRCIPSSAWEYGALDRELESCGPVDAGILLLGTNDLLMGRSPERVSSAMEALVSHLKAFGFPLVLLSPPDLRLPEPELRRALEAAAGFYQALAQREGLLYLDIRSLPLSCDGVHLSEEGHRLLARHLASLLRLQNLL